MEFPRRRRSLCRANLKIATGLMDERDGRKVNEKRFLRNHGFARSRARDLAQRNRTARIRPITRLLVRRRKAHTGQSARAHLQKIVDRDRRFVRQSRLSRRSRRREADLSNVRARNVQSSGNYTTRHFPVSLSLFLAFLLFTTRRYSALHSSSMRAVGSTEEDPKNSKLRKRKRERKRREERRKINTRNSRRRCIRRRFQRN